LQKAIDQGEEAIDTTPSDHPDRARFLSNLASSLNYKFEQTNELDNLQKAINKGEEAVIATPSNHPQRAARLAHLARFLQRRFERTGDLDDLQKAISIGEEAAIAISPDHTHRPSILNMLVICLQNRFVRTGNLNDLQKAISRCEEVVAITPHDHFDKAARLSTLATLFSTRFSRTGNPDDLQMAIHNNDEAILAIPHGHPDRAAMLTNMAICLLDYFKQSGNLDTLQKAISRAQESADATPHGHPHRALVLNNHADTLEAKFERTGDVGSSEQAVCMLTEAVESENSPPQHRIQAALRAVRMLARNRNWVDVSRIAETAVKLLPRVSPRALKQTDQQYMLGQFAGLATTAASAAVQAGMEASFAVELLELGRGVIFGLQFGTRRDLTDLRKASRELAEQFERLRDELGSPSSNAPLQTAEGHMVGAASQSSGRHDTSLAFEKVVEEIRNLPGFKNFLQPPQADELRLAASFGPIILINVSEYHCGAFLVESHAMRVLPLPRLKHSDIEKNANILRSIRHDPTSSKGQMSRMLEWLWDVAAGPILDELGFREPPSDGKWPHVWWIPTGELSLLPLHAAGYHYPKTSETVLDRVVSSYSPSIKALLYARQNAGQKDVNSAPDEVLLVSMPTTPGCSDLKFAREEVKVLDGLFPASVPKVKLEQPCTEAVLSRLGTSEIFHFAGHGASDPLDPSKSRLLLNDWQENPLTVERLIEVKLYQKSPWLAFLSACSTGESQSKSLHDESIHLVSACQLAGFRHVIGTLWEVSDPHCVDVARVLYETIRDEGMIDTAVSRGLHQATRALRDRGDTGAIARNVNVLGPADFDSDLPDLYWVPYTHFGA
jgi:tetratricopeptide (TPR) repeat protein